MTWGRCPEGRVSRGDDHPLSKLSQKKADAIKEEYENGETTYEVLAKKYRVSPGAIGRVIRRETWVRV